VSAKLCFAREDPALADYAKRSFEITRTSVNRRSTEQYFIKTITPVYANEPVQLNNFNKAKSKFESRD